MGAEVVRRVSGEPDGGASRRLVIGEIEELEIDAVAEGPGRVDENDFTAPEGSPSATKAVARSRVARAVRSSVGRAARKPRQRFESA